MLFFLKNKDFSISSTLKFFILKNITEPDEASIEIRQQADMRVFKNKNKKILVKKINLFFLSLRVII